MNTNVINRTRRVGSFLLVVGAVFLAAQALLFYEMPVHESVRTYSSQLKEGNESEKADHPFSLDPTLRVAKLKLIESIGYNGHGHDIFHADRERSLKEIAPPHAPNPQSPLPGVVQPVVPLRFFGFVSISNIPRKGFFADADAVFVASEGELIDRRYKVLTIGVESVEVRDLIANSTHKLSLPR